MIFGNWIRSISKNFITTSGALASYIHTLGMYDIELLVAFLLQRTGGLYDGYWYLGNWDYLDTGYGRDFL